MKAYRLLAIDHLTEHTFRLRTERPDGVIKAGQCFNLGLPGLGINREYSIYSTVNSGYLDFLIRSVDNGLVSRQLQQTRPGDLIEIDGPYGEFYLEEPIDEHVRYLFIGTGTGIAPFHSFVETYKNLSYTILHGVRTEEECYHAFDYHDGCYQACISKPSNGRPGQRVTDSLVDIPMSVNTNVYLCGNRNMIVDVYEILSKTIISSDQIKAEVFF